MIIKKIYVENFGKILKIELSFEKGINEIYKENGWGKSTITAFIKAMLYGMPAKKKGNELNFDRVRYNPWQGGKFGGFLEFEGDKENFRITRYFGNTPEGDFYELRDLKTNTIEDKEQEILGEKLFGLGRESFEVTAFFPQLKFASTTNTQITANLTGVDKFQYDLSNVEQAIKIIDGKIKDLKKDKPKKEEIIQIKREIKQNQELIEEKILKRQEEGAKIKESEKEIGLLQDKIKEKREEINLQKSIYLNKVKIEEQVNEKNVEKGKLLEELNKLKDEKIAQDSTNKKESKPKGKAVLTSIPFVLTAFVMIALIAMHILPIIFAVLGALVLISLYIITLFFVLKKSNEKEDEKEENNYDEIKNLSSKIASVNENLLLLSAQLETLKEIKEPDQSRLEAFLEDEKNKEIEKITLENDSKRIIREIDDLIEINDRKNDELNLLIEREEETTKKIEILLKTKGFLLQAKENVSTRFIVPINEQLKKFLSKFSEVKKDYVVNTEWNVKEQTNYGLKDLEYSSQGLKDIVSFCQRITLINEIYKKEKPVIILDDTFVNLDDKNLKIAKSIVEEISKDFQTIYICCNERCSIK